MCDLLLTEFHPIARRAPSWTLGMGMSSNLLGPGLDTPRPMTWLDVIGSPDAAVHVPFCAVTKSDPGR